MRGSAGSVTSTRDPPGASRVEVTDPADPRNAPEATDPKTDFSVDPDAAKDR